MHSIAGPVVLLWHTHSQLYMPGALQQSISEASKTPWGAMMKRAKMTFISHLVSGVKLPLLTYEPKYDLSKQREYLVFLSYDYLIIIQR